MCLIRCFLRRRRYQQVQAYRKWLAEYLECKRLRAMLDGFEGENHRERFWAIGERFRLNLHLTKLGWYKPPRPARRAATKP